MRKTPSPGVNHWITTYPGDCMIFLLPPMNTPFPTGCAIQRSPRPRSSHESPWPRPGLSFSLAPTWPAPPWYKEEVSHLADPQSVTFAETFWWVDRGVPEGVVLRTHDAPPGVSSGTASADAFRASSAAARFSVTSSASPAGSRRSRSPARVQARAFFARSAASSSVMNSLVPNSFGSFKRCRREVLPHSLQIRIAPRGAGRASTLSPRLWFFPRSSGPGRRTPPARRPHSRSPADLLTRVIVPHLEISSFMPGVPSQIAW